MQALPIAITLFLLLILILFFRRSSGAPQEVDRPEYNIVTIGNGDKLKGDTNNNSFTPSFDGGGTVLCLRRDNEDRSSFRLVLTSGSSYATTVEKGGGSNEKDLKFTSEKPSDAEFKLSANNVLQTNVNGIAKDLREFNGKVTTIGSGLSVKLEEKR